MSAGFYQVSELVAAGRPIDEVLAVVRSELIELLRLRDCRFERGQATPDHIKELQRDGHVALAALTGR